MNNFQTILVAAFLAFFIFAVLIFSGLLKIGEEKSQTSNLSGKVVVWGTFNNPDIFKVFDNLKNDNKDLYAQYVIKNKATYQRDLVEAFAAGTGPDLFFMTPDMILPNDPYIYKIPYASYPEKTFRDSFIDGASIYLEKDGATGFPIAIDPMVLYYNRDMLSNQGIATPPESWDQLFDLAPRLTVKKNDGTITTSMIALGRYDNITHAKDVLATLLFQSGNPIVGVASNGTHISVLSDNPSALAVSPIEGVLNFYTEFSNPTDAAYSWNRALQNSMDMFTGGKLAFYLGKASELFKIETVNPNLSFDVATMLQTKGSNIKRTAGDIYAVAVNKKSSNIASAFGVAGLLSSSTAAKELSVALSLPPALRSLLSEKPTDPYLFTFWNSAIITRSWLDPNQSASDDVFSELIENITSNKLSIDDAIGKAQNQLQFLIKN